MFSTNPNVDMVHLANSLDVNNNENLDLNRNEKYSLRQRYKRTPTHCHDPCSDDTASSSPKRASSPTRAASKSKSRAPPRNGKKGKPFLSVEDLHMGSPMSPSSVTSSSSGSSYGNERSAKEKPKTKAPPLSKYRRKTANARERTRMREINSAFETLRKCVPMSVCLTNNASHFDPMYLTTHQAPGAQVQVTTPGNEKLTKITTLKVAMKYIRMLTEVLNGSMPMAGQSESVGVMGSAANSNLKTSLLSIKVSPSHGTKKNGQKNSNLLMTTTTPRGGCKQASVRVRGPVNANTVIVSQQQSEQQQQHPSPSRLQPTAVPQQQHQSNFEATSYNPFLATGVDMLFGSPCLTPPIDDSAFGSTSCLGTITDNGISDEDSMRSLSDSCLSPPLSEQNIKLSFNTLIPEESAPDLELSFLLDSDSDTLQLSEPCLSPLSGALDPFNDLLTSGFNEQTVLDMYL